MNYFKFSFLIVLIGCFSKGLTQPLSSIKCDSGILRFSQAKIFKGKMEVPVPDGFKKANKKSGSKYYSVGKSADAVIYKNKDGSELCYYFTNMIWDDSQYGVKIWDTAHRLVSDNFNSFHWHRSGWQKIDNRSIFFIQLDKCDRKSNHFVLLMLEELKGMMVFTVYSSPKVDLISSKEITNKLIEKHFLPR